MCDPVCIKPMTRLLIWGGVALGLHAVLLLVPIYDTSLDSAVGSGGVSVHIKNAQSSGQTNAGVQALPAPQQINLADSSGTHNAAAPELESMPEAVKLQGNFSAPSNVVPEKIAIKQEVMPSKLMAGVKSDKVVATTQETTDKPRIVTENTIASNAAIKQEMPENPTSKDSDDIVENAQDLAKSDNHENISAKKSRLISARPVSKNKPKYPRRAIIRNQQGDVKVELLIKHDGLVEEAVLLESSGFPLLDKSVMKFVNKERFIAALENGIPVASTQLFTYRFVLK